MEKDMNFWAWSTISGHWCTATIPRASRETSGSITTIASAAGQDSMARMPTCSSTKEYNNRDRIIKI